MPKSYAPTAEFKRCPEPQPWWSYSLHSAASPGVLRRKFGYVKRAYERLAKWERIFDEERSKREMDRHPKALANIREHIEHRKRRLNYSVTTLRNSVRFALARIEQDSEDHKTMREKRKQAAIRGIGKLPEFAQGFAYDVLFEGLHTKTLAFKYDITKEEARACADEIRKRVPVHPILKQTGKNNEKVHKEIRYYSKVVDQYIMAKAVASGSSRANDAMTKLLELCDKTIKHYMYKSGRELDDARQQASRGILEACRDYEPDERLAQFNTFATYKIWRRTQTRKASHCKPGTAMVSKKTIPVQSIDYKPKGDDSTTEDLFHPAVETATVTELTLDIQSVLKNLSDEERTIAQRHIMLGEKAADVAEDLDLSIGQFRARVNKLKEKLRCKLKDHR